MQAYSHGLLGNCRRIETRRASVLCHANVSFSVQKQVGWGDKLIVVGDRKPLGSWKVDGAAELQWNKDDVWTGSVEIPNNCDVEFKVVKVTGHGDAQWEKGDNRKYHVDDKDVVLHMEWGNTREVKSTVSAECSGPVQNGSSSETSSDSESDSQSSNANGSSLQDDRLPHTKWQGKDIDFMKENNHTKERRGVWNKDGLEGSILELVKGDEGAASWLQKLEVAKTLIVDKSVDMRPDLEALAPLYIYLSWISTGSIQCVEGGGHYRPNRHAELSKVMFRSMEWVSGDNRKTALERLVARKLVAKLPSFSEAFTASVPLTRIRDIAHRNDIPSDLKREIKHTLQNKLHRNAGPEDLVATELMLERITSKPGEYSEAFVNEFKVFTEELRDFFSAGSLAFMLEAVLPAMDEGERIAVQRFLEAKAKVDGAATADWNLLMDLLHKLTTVRAILLAKLASGLRNDAPDAAMAMRQRVRVAEIRCEDYGYMTLSRVNNLLEEQGGSAFLAGAREEAWAQPIGAMVLSVRNCGLSGWQPAECYAIEQELEAWQKLGVLGDKEQLIRLKASLERTKRLTDDYAEVLLDTFAESALTMGRALGMPAEVQQVFTEAEIRANIAFQLSKLTTSLLKAARSVLGSGDFDPLVMGTAVGELVAVERITAGKELAGGRPCVLLVEEADGDEEVAAAGKNIRGVILCQDLPHLSHLGVRARQERVTFVTTTTTEVLDSVVRPLIGKQVELIADASQVTVRAASSDALAASTAKDTSSSSSSNGSTPPVPVSVPAAGVKKVAAATVVALHSATTEACGAKASACAKLSNAARKSSTGAAFSAPAGAVLPFGCMEAAIKAAGKTAEFEDLLKQMETCAADALLPLCDKMQALITQCPPDAATIAALQKELPDAGVVIARSSANVEDLAGMSGAGLYESIPNVELSSADSVSEGVTKVWASLFARRAVLSRRAAGVAQKDACMAVLVQEMLAPDTCFVLHTRNPMADSEPDRGASSLYAEVAPGMGEILASGTSGSAWRMTVDKATSSVATLAFANFSHAFLPSTGERTIEPGASIYWSSHDGDDAVATAAGKVTKKTVDYSKQKLSTNAESRTELAQQLCRIGVALEEMFGASQDIEGALVGSRVYVVQTRPQP